MIRTFSLIIILLSVTVSCTESVIPVQDYEDVIIDGNTIDSSFTYSKIDVENYVNRAYIDLWGELSEDTEDIVNQLIQDSLSVESRTTFIRQLIEAPRFFEFLKEQDYAAYLNGTGEYEIEEQLNTYYALALDYYEREEFTLYYFFIDEFNKLTRLLDLDRLLQQDSLTTSDYYSVLATNVIYDEINMGSENFSNSVFENFIGRLPTDFELEQSVLMVDNQPGIIMNQDGNSKPDLLKILTTSLEFEHHIIQSTHNRLTSKALTPQELVEFQTQLPIGENIEQLYLAITTSDQYVFNL